MGSAPAHEEQHDEREDDRPYPLSARIESIGWQSENGDGTTPYKESLECPLKRNAARLRFKPGHDAFDQIRCLETHCDFCEYIETMQRERFFQTFVKARRC